MKVYNLESPRTGKAVANQYIIDNGDIEYFQSYDSIIAKWDRQKYPARVTLDLTYWDYSVTTLKYLKVFLTSHGYGGITKNDIQAMIDDGTFATEDMNSK